MLVFLLLTSGCRRWEALGLKWEGGDFTYSRIHICRNLLYTVERGGYEDTTKTQNSVRYVTLPASTMAELQNYRVWQDAEKARLAYGFRHTIASIARWKRRNYGYGTKWNMSFT